MRTFFIVALLLTLIISVSCKKKTTPATTTTTTTQKGITYPDSIYYGKNSLTLPDSTILADSKDYGFAAILEKDASLSIVITDLNTTPDTATGHFPVWSYNISTTGWAVQNWTANNTQKFIASQTGKVDLAISFYAYGKTGKCKIDFYENSSTITRTKYLKWQ